MSIEEERLVKALRKACENNRVDSLEVLQAVVYRLVEAYTAHVDHPEGCGGARNSAVEEICDVLNELQEGDQVFQSPYGVTYEEID